MKIQSFLQIMHVAVGMHGCVGSAMITYKIIHGTASTYLTICRSYLGKWNVPGGQSEMLSDARRSLTQNVCAWR